MAFSHNNASSGGSLRESSVNIDLRVSYVTRRWMQKTPLRPEASRCGFEGLAVLDKVDFIVGHWMRREDLAHPWKESSLKRDRVCKIVEAQFAWAMREVRELAAEGREAEAARILDSKIGPPGDICRRSIQRSYSVAGQVRGDGIGWSRPPSGL